MFKNTQLRKALVKAGIVSFEKMWPHDPPCHHTGPKDWQINQLNREVKELQKQVLLLAECNSVEFGDGNFLRHKDEKKLGEKVILLPDKEQPRTTII